MRSHLRFPTHLCVLLICSAAISSCSTHEVQTERVQSRVIAYDQSVPLPQDSGLKVNLPCDVEGLMFQPGKPPEQVTVSQGTYVLQGVNVYRRMFAKIVALQEYLASLPEPARSEAMNKLAAAESANLSGK